MASSTNSISYSFFTHFARTNRSPLILPQNANFPLSKPYNFTLKLTHFPNFPNTTCHCFRPKSPMADVQSQKGSSNLNVFDSEEELAVSLAKYTADLSQKFVKERGSLTVVVSGGSLIKSLRKLLEPPYVDSIDWSKWHVFWVDERVVPKDHPDSNYKLAYDGFLSKGLKFEDMLSYSQATTWDLQPIALEAPPIPCCL